MPRSPCEALTASRTTLDAPVLVGAVIAYFLANSGTVATAVALSTHQPVGRVWQQNFMWSGPSYFIGAAVSTLIAEGVSRGMWWLLPVTAVTLSGLAVAMTWSSAVAR